MSEIISPGSIRDHWNQVAQTWKDDPSGAMPDKHLRQLELDLALKMLRPDDSILDLGCGNGKITLELARRTAGPTIGVDFADQMIGQATRLLIAESKDLQSRVKFFVGDVAEFGLKQKFSKIHTFRCLINIPEIVRQKQLIEKIADWLSPGGVALLSESTIQGFAALNPVREKLGLPPVRVRWHNNPVDEEFISLECERNGLKLAEVIDYSSTYYLISRCLNIKYAQFLGEQSEFVPAIDDIAVQLPSVGNYGLLRMIKIVKPN